jgi:hypothetical protein
MSLKGERERILHNNDEEDSTIIFSLLYLEFLKRLPFKFDRNLRYKSRQFEVTVLNKR